MLPNKQPSVKKFFSTLTPDEYYESELPKLATSVPLLTGLTPLPQALLTKDAKHEIQNSRKKQNMRDMRGRRKAKEIVEGKRDAEGTLIKEKKDVFQILDQTKGGSHSYQLDMALTTNHSRPLAKRVRIEGSDPTDGLDGTQVLTKNRNRKNWFHPHIWPAIDVAAKRTNYSAREIVKYLQSRHQDTGLYDALNSSTVNNWIDKSASAKRQWLSRIEESVTQATCWNPTRQRYESILDGKDELIEKIKETLLAIRQASLTVNANLARSIILGYIQAESPELLGEGTTCRPRGKTPIFSLTTTRRFLYDHLNWSSCRATKDGQKTPLDWENLCLATFFRFLYTVLKENIHQCMIINMDQTRVVLVPGANNATYEKKGAKQVPIHGKDEKRAFTAVLSVSMSSKVLPIQSV